MATAGNRGTSVVLASSCGDLFDLTNSSGILVVPAHLIPCDHCEVAEVVNIMSNAVVSAGYIVSCSNYSDDPPCIVSVEETIVTCE